MRQRKAADTWVQVLSLTMGVVLLLGVLLLLAASGSTPARDVLSLFTGIAAGAGLIAGAIHLGRVWKPAVILLVVVWGALIVIPVIITPLSFGIFYFGGVAGFAAVILTWWMNKRREQKEEEV
jgi:hypothetical protein